MSRNFAYRSSHRLLSRHKKRSTRFSYMDFSAKRVTRWHNPDVQRVCNVLKGDTRWHKGDTCWRNVDACSAHNKKCLCFVTLSRLNSVGNCPVFFLSAWGSFKFSREFSALVPVQLCCGRSKVLNSRENLSAYHEYPFSYGYLPVEFGRGKTVWMTHFLLGGRKRVSTLRQHVSPLCQRVSAFRRRWHVITICISMVYRFVSAVSPFLSYFYV